MYQTINRPLKPWWLNERFVCNCKYLIRILYINFPFTRMISLYFPEFNLIVYIYISCTSKQVSLLLTSLKQEHNSLYHPVWIYKIPSIEMTVLLLDIGGTYSLRTHYWTVSFPLMMIN